MVKFYSFLAVFLVGISGVASALEYTHRSFDNKLKNTAIVNEIASLTSILANIDVSLTNVETNVINFIDCARDQLAIYDGTACTRPDVAPGCGTVEVNTSNPPSFSPSYSGTASAFSSISSISGGVRISCAPNYVVLACTAYEHSTQENNKLHVGVNGNQTYCEIKLGDVQGYAVCCEGSL